MYFSLSKIKKIKIGECIGISHMASAIIGFTKFMNCKRHFYVNNCSRSKIINSWASHWPFYVQYINAPFSSLFIYIAHFYYWIYCVFLFDQRRVILLIICKVMIKRHATFLLGLEFETLVKR